MKVQAARKQCIVIHGWGGTYRQAALRLLALLDVESFWHQGHILVPSRQATLLRHLINEPSDDRNQQLLCKLIVSRFLMSPPLPQVLEKEMNRFSRFSEDRLREQFPELGIPLAPDARRTCAAALARDAENKLRPLLDILADLEKNLAQSNADLSEATVRDALTTLVNARTTKICDPVDLLETLREMHETGGDLDTVASAVLYATSLRQQARSLGLPWRYGRDFEFVFVNYHESLASLKAHAPADLFLADLPVAAFPDLEKDIRELAQHDVTTARFEDHHPYDPTRKQALEKMVADGLIGHLSLSGPPQGVELPGEELMCAADMVFESCVAGTPADTPAAKRLRQAAHGEDFVTNRTEFGILLTNLIKGGICKVELAQILLATMDTDDAMDALEKRGWAKLPALWQSNLSETAATILQNATMLHLQDGHTRIVCAKAVHAEPGSPKLPTGKAIEFLARSFPDAQYAFYCFGASLMVARRLDQADTTLNLGSIMPVIGTPGDGGHAGAAVCRPEANPRYPHKILRQVSPNNFMTFARYLSTKLTQAGYPVARVRNCSQPPNTHDHAGTRKLAWILAISFLMGLALLLFVPFFRPAQVRESNANFFPQINIAEDDYDSPSLPGEVQP